MTAKTACTTCLRDARLTTGAEVYPHRPDLSAKQIWKCDGCGAYVGCHPGSTDPLGTPAGPQLRAARMALHNALIDPLWKDAWREPAYAEIFMPNGRPQVIGKKTLAKQKMICRTARNRVYEFLAARLGITRDECHTGLFDIDDCRAASVALRGVSYADIRAWAHQRRAAA